MKTIRLVNVTKSYNGEVILENLNLEIPMGQFFALLGPSGCGKTTILRLIAGFEQPDEGRIYLGDQDITDLPSNQRSVNTVFQQYALFPHMNVFENVAYSLTVQNMPKAKIEKKVKKVLKAVRLEAQSFKAIGQLSGGQQQRVALARAIVNDPKVLLLDEPLAALDVKLREQMLVELIDLQDQLKTTFVYVTHDQLEALTVADQMAIMSPQGIIEQAGPPKAVYEFPTTVFVANFVGTSNIMKGEFGIKGDDAYVDVKDLGKFGVEASDTQIATGTDVYMSVRPEKLVIKKKLDSTYDNHVEGTVDAIVFHGYSTLYHVRLKNDFKIIVFEQNSKHTAHERIDYDDHVYVHWDEDVVVILER